MEGPETPKQRTRVVATLQTNLKGGLAKAGKYESMKERLIDHKDSRSRTTALRSTLKINEQVGTVSLYEKWHTTARTARGQLLHEICWQGASGRPLIYSQSGKRVGVIFDWLGADDSGTFGR